MEHAEAMQTIVTKEWKYPPEVNGQPYIFHSQGLLKRIDTPASP